MLKANADRWLFSFRK